MAESLTTDTKAIIAAITKADSLASESRERIAGELHHHTEQDDERFRALTGLVNSIATDVKSLLESRTFARGASWMVVKIAAGVAAAVALIPHAIAYVRSLTGH